jgi:hypothetical protein
MVKRYPTDLTDLEWAHSIAFSGSRRALHHCLEISTCYPHCVSSADENLMTWG